MRRLDRLCSQVAQDGRVIPFNFLSINFWVCPTRLTDCSRRCPNAGYINVKNNLKLRYLHIYLPYFGNVCPAQEAILTLLLRSTSMTSQLQVIGMNNIDQTHAVFSNSMRPDWKPWFPKLEKIIISNMKAFNLSVQRELLQKMLDGAPNLNKIVAQDNSSLEVVPEGRYALLDSLHYRFTKLREADLFRSIAAQSAGLTQLSIYQPFTGRFCEAYGEDPVDEAFQLIFDTVLELLLKASHSVVEDISVVGAYRLDSLTFSPLPTLSKLAWQKQYGEPSSAQDLWNAIVAMDYEDKMPRLHEMKISIRALDEKPFDGFRPEDNSTEEWPQNSGPIQSCGTVRYLKLQLQVQRINMTCLKAVFPNVSILELDLGKTLLEGEDQVPISGISKAWPQLQELLIFGKRNRLGRCWDYEFCGIHEEEVELLRNQPRAYLEVVQIVPIRPSILTMPSEFYCDSEALSLRVNWEIKSCFNVSDLRRCHVHLEYGRGESQGRPDWISDVTFLVVLQRMPHVSTSVWWTFEDTQKEYGYQNK